MENEKKLSAFIGSEYIDKHQNNQVQYFKQWSKGNIIFTNGDEVKDEYLSYNILLDEVLWMRDYDYKKVTLDRRFIKEFIIYPENSDSARFIKVDFKNNLHSTYQDTFMELLSDGEIRLLKYIYAIEVSYNGEIYFKENYYLYKENEYQSFMLTRNSFFQLFGADKKTMKQIFRSNHLSVKNEKDLKKALEIYNHS